MDINKELEITLIRAELLNVASQLKDDEMYIKDLAINDLIKVVSMIDEFKKSL